MNPTTYKLKSNNRTIDTFADPVEAQKAALDLADRTDEAVTVDPDPLRDLASFARDFPVNFRLACGYPCANLPSYPLPKINWVEPIIKKITEKSESDCLSLCCDSRGREWF